MNPSLWPLHAPLLRSASVRPLMALAMGSFEMAVGEVEMVSLQFEVAREEIAWL